METIQYSLNNISIDIKLAIEYSEKQSIGKKENHIQLPQITEIPKDENDIFDEHCLEIYGKKTCILIEIGKDTFQRRFLNNDLKNNITRHQFSTEIPELIEKLYTVIIVEEIEDEGIREIVAIHSPSN